MPVSKEFLLTALVFVAVLTSVFGAYLFVSSRKRYRGSIETRLHTSDRSLIQTRAELVKVRRSRSLNSEGNYLLPLVALNELILQSGSVLGLSGFLIFGAAAGFTGFLATRVVGLDLPVCVLIAVSAGILLPILTLRRMRDQRRSKFEEQLPDALDVLVRSVKAGHALSAAVASVGRHLPDPIGSEFSLTAAEVTYGLDLETAMINLRSRVGQADLALIVLAISIQSKTGGNLAEILSNLSKIIRERFKLRRRAHALAAEGRFSAILLSLMPVALFGVLRLISPGYYGDIWASASVKYVLAGALAWMLLGDYVMFRMVRIKV